MQQLRAKVVECDGKKCVAFELPPDFEGGGMGADATATLDLNAIDWQTLLKALAPVLISILQKLVAS